MVVSQSRSQQNDWSKNIENLYNPRRFCQLELRLTRFDTNAKKTRHMVQNHGHIMARHTFRSDKGTCNGVPVINNIRTLPESIQYFTRKSASWRRATFALSAEFLKLIHISYIYWITARSAVGTFPSERQRFIIFTFFQCLKLITTRARCQLGTQLHTSSSLRMLFTTTRVQ